MASQYGMMLDWLVENGTWYSRALSLVILYFLLDKSYILKMKSNDWNVVIVI
jgi:hypothetical protein